MNIPQPSARRFEGKTALVTGAAGGIGSAISARLAAEGAYVVVCDVNADAANRFVSDLQAAGNSAEAKAFDLADSAACRTIVDEVMESRGRIDVLANNAGINRRGDLLSLGSDPPLPAARRRHHC
ncbi:SDR family NAD(P)-dependent oxidoreductase [Arthrobacter sp. ISL-28]|uniref:SDR family NAD(P)-dependent oxidoreductase n=1 Tax=Arthrobacter sp. ISL-28 TaxID=2819108 RepID=UPI001BED38F9|nr:SDR family NAD(P)-dependent oxidoreductase [Arthrobacter sp. ISL-28]MBT2523563.1 SDR family NAD(P)-dependent oxidoreductase [Arthrobacter sp. ISL-28]